MECLIHSPAFKFDKSQSMCPRKQTKEKPITASYEKASHGTKLLQGRARTTRKLQGDDVSRLCKQDQCEPAFNSIKMAWVAGLGSRTVQAKTPAASIARADRRGAHQLCGRGAS